MEFVVESCKRFWF